MWTHACRIQACKGGSAAQLLTFRRRVLKLYSSPSAPLGSLFRGPGSCFQGLSDFLPMLLVEPDQIWRVLPRPM